MKIGWTSALLVLLAMPVWAQEKVKIGFIDLQRAISESQAGKKAKERFETEVKKFEAELLKEKHEVERLKGDFEKRSPLLKEEERRNLEKEFQRRYLGYQRVMRDSQEELRQKEGEMTAEILKELEKIVAEVGKGENFTLIFERSQLPYSDPGIDIPNRVIQLYNTRAPAKGTKGK
ncbi:MAG: OmpH family outer membrane protein [Deltaproteobacteria bacterium]|nr:OmpH family outer membrane protein [Deltaproteobacteria bacterium]